MNFDLILDQQDFDNIPAGVFDDYNTADFHVTAEFLPGDDSVGQPDVWDVDVFFGNLRVTWDLKTAKLRQIEDMCYERRQLHIADRMLDNAISKWEACHE